MESAPSPADPELVQTLRTTGPGRQVFGRFRLVRELGKGGMGIVWLAQDERLGLEVALKFLPGMVASDPEALHELRQEITRGLRLTHEGIVRVYDLHEAPAEGLAAIAMEYVAGGSLSEVKGRQPGRCFEPAALVDWLRQLCEVLAYVHERAQIVHRDLKPRNLMLTPEGRLKVADFGIAATISDSHSRLTNTHSSGTPAYMSPQQAIGRRPLPADDIYAVGATVYELLTGKPPFFRGSATAILHQLTTEVPPSMTGRREELEVNGRPPLPPAWEETVAACLQKDPALRPANVREVARRLGLSGEAPVHAPSAKSTREPTAPAPATAPGPKRHRAWVAAGCCVVIAAVLVLWLARRSPQPELVHSETAFRAVPGTVPTESASVIPEVAVIAVPVPPNGVPALRHTASVLSAMFSPDGTKVVTASLDMTAQVWDAQTGARIGRPLQHKGPVATACFSPDGSKVVTASWDMTARLWEAETGRPLGSEMWHKLMVTSAAFNPEGTEVLTASADHTARVWSAETGKPMVEPLQHEGDLSSARFGWGGDKIVTTSPGNIATLWEAFKGSWRRKAVFERAPSMFHNQGWMGYDCLSLDTGLVVTLDAQNRAFLRETAGEAPSATELPHGNAVEFACFSPESTQVLTALADYTVQLWDAPTGSTIGQPMTHPMGVRLASYSADEKWVVTAALDHAARIWDAHTGQLIGKPMVHAEEITSASFSADGTRVLTSSADQTARLWDARSGEPLKLAAP